MKGRKLWLPGDPDNLLEVVRRPSGNPAQLAPLCGPAQAGAASVKDAEQNGVENPLPQSGAQGFSYKAA